MHTDKQYDWATGLGLVIFLNDYMSRAMRKYANNKGADQSVHPRSLISAFVVCSLDSTISLDLAAEISRL